PGGVHIFEAVEALKPTGIIGVGTVPKLFKPEGIEGMAKIKQRPIIFPYLKPTSRSECTGEKALRLARGRGGFRSRRPIPPGGNAGTAFGAGRGKHRLLLPGQGLGGIGAGGGGGDGEYFLCRRAGGRGAVNERKSLEGSHLPAAESYPQCVAARRRTDRRLHFREGAGARAATGRYRCADPRPRLSASLRGVKSHMMLEERSNLVLAFARRLYVNGQATEQTVAAAEQLGRALGLRAKVLPRWGELQLKSEDKDGELISLVAADPTGVDMDRVACAVRAMEELGGDRLTPETAAATAGAIASAPPAPTWLFTLAAGA